MVRWGTSPPLLSQEPTCSKEEALMKGKRERNGRSKRWVEMDEDREEAGEEREGK